VKLLSGSSDALLHGRAPQAFPTEHGPYAWITPRPNYPLLLMTMKISQLIEALQSAYIMNHEDMDVVLCFEEGAIDEGFDWSHVEGITDVRVTRDWPLPGDSLVNHAEEISNKVIIFYNLIQKLDSSAPEL
jgi:hypothetical protein